MLFITILFLILCGVIQISNQTGSHQHHQTSLWDHVVSMKQIIVSIEYEGRHLHVWREHKHSESIRYDRYYVTPLVEFVVNNTNNCKSDPYSNDKRYVFAFYIRIWSKQVAELVQLKLSQMGMDVELSDISPIPMQQVKIEVNQDVTSKMYASDKWRSNLDHSNEIAFELYTHYSSLCKKMLEHAKKDPKEFLERTQLDFQFTMEVKQNSYRYLNISGSALSNSKFFSNLKNNYAKNFPNDVVYLKSDDLNKLSRDIYRSVTINDEETFGYIPSAQENSIVENLLQVLVEQKVHTKELTENEWDSVFWDNIYSRPDIQTQYFNGVMTYDQGKDQFKYHSDKEQQTRKIIESKVDKVREKSSAGGAGVEAFGVAISSWGSSGSKEGDSTSSKTDNYNQNRNILSTDKMNEFLVKNNFNTKWTGEKFEPKSFDLHRLNTRSLISKAEILYKRVVTIPLTTTQTFKVKPERSLNFEENTPTIIEKINQISNMTSELRNEFSNVQNNVNANFSALSPQISSLTEKVNINKHNIAENTKILYEINVFSLHPLAGGEMRNYIALPGSCTNMAAQNWNTDWVCSPGCVILCTETNCGGRCETFSKVCTSVFTGVNLVKSYKGCFSWK